jgi:phage terminase large subunit GpA-like protein
MTRAATYSFITNRVALLLRPAPKISVSEWADQNRILVRESSSTPGRWRTDVCPYTREIQNSMSSSDIRKVVCMLAAQVGKTEFLLNAIGYQADCDAGPALWVLPNEKLAKDYSVTRLAPMIRSTPALRAKFADARARDGSNNRLQKTYPGGYLALASAESPAELAGRPIRYLFCDEVDRWSNSRECDPLALAERRTSTLYN